MRKMSTRRYLLATIPLYILVLATFFVPSLLVTPVSASHTPANPFTWRTYGPESQFLRFQYYASDLAEFTALTTGGAEGIDLYDFPLSISQRNQISGDPTLSANIDMTVNVDEFGMRQIDVNQHNSFFGVPADNGNSPITQQLIAAITHMIDKERWIVEGPVGGLASRIDTPDAAGHFVDVDNNPANGVQGYSPAWDTLHPGTISAFNSVAEGVGTFGIPPVGTIDFCAAADHVVEFGRLAALAGHFGGVNPFSKTAGTCVVTGWTSSMGQLVYATRNEAGEIRLDLGTRHTAAIESLFGGANVVNEIFGNIDQLRPVVFQHCAVCTPGAHTYSAASVNDWHFYTGGWGLGSFADHGYFLYGNFFSGRANQALNAQGLANANCDAGNPQFRFPLNYPGFCRSDYDPIAFEASLAAIDVPQHISAVNRAEAIAGERLAVIPILAFSSPRAALHDAVYTIAIGDGVHTPPTWNLARPRNPADNGLYDFGGPGTANDNIIRQGNKQGTVTLNPFQATTFWEFQVITAIYDSMLSQNPDAPTQQFFDWQSKTHVAFTNPTAAQLGYAPPAGTAMTTRWELKPGILFHDGSTLNALDVAFTAIAYRDAPATNLGSLFSEMLNVTIVDCGPACGTEPKGGPGEPLILDIHWSSATFFHELNSGGAPLLPRELWEDTTGASTVALFGGFPGASTVINSFSIARTALGFDPMVAGTLVGTGNWVCRDLSNPSRIGGGCARTAAGTPDDGSLSAGSTLLMERNDGFFRAKAGALYKALNWADSIRDNAFWGTPSLPAHRHPDILGDGWMNLNDLTQFTFCIGGDVAACGASALVVSGGLTAAQAIDYFRVDDVPGLTQFAGIETSLIASTWEQDIYASIGPSRNDPRTSVIGVEPFDPSDADYHL